MPSSTAQRRDHLASLQLPGTIRFGSAPVEPVRRLSTGIPALDQLLGGGIPCGGLSEVTGMVSSGRTALLCALLATATGRGEVVAVVDLPDALHPESLGAAGVDLRRVLWVRPPSMRVSLKCTDLILSAGGFALVVLDVSGAVAQCPPLPVWLRLGRLAKRSQTAVTILSEQRLAGSVAALSVTLARQQVQWGDRWRSMLEGMTAHVTVARSKVGVPRGGSALLVTRR